MAIVNKLTIDDNEYWIADSVAREYIENGGVYIDPNEEEPEIPDIPDTPGGGGRSGETPSAEDITYNPNQTGLSATNVQDAIDEVFQSVSNGKELVASAITDKGVPTNKDATFLTMAENINLISTPGETEVNFNIHFGIEEPEDKNKLWIKEDKPISCFISNDYSGIGSLTPLYMGFNDKSSYCLAANIGKTIYVLLPKDSSNKMQITIVKIDLENKSSLKMLFTLEEEFYGYSESYNFAAVIGEDIYFELYATELLKFNTVDETIEIIKSADSPGAWADSVNIDNIQYSVRQGSTQLIKRDYFNYDTPIQLVSNAQSSIYNPIMYATNGYIYILSSSTSSGKMQDLHIFDTSTQKFIDYLILPDLSDWSYNNKISLAITNNVLYLFNVNKSQVYTYNLLSKEYSFISLNLDSFGQNSNDLPILSIGNNLYIVTATGSIAKFQIYVPIEELPFGYYLIDGLV